MSYLSLTFMTEVIRAYDVVFSYADFLAVTKHIIANCGSFERLRGTDIIF